MVIEPLLAPVAPGVNVTLTLQVLLGVAVAPLQVSAILAKSLAFVSPIVTVEMLRLAGAGVGDGLRPGRAGGAKVLRVER